MHTKLIAIVPAAGVGLRALADSRTSDIPKQYRLLNGQPMLRWAVRALLADERIEQVRVAVAADDPWVDAALEGLPRTVWRPCGGPTRAATVLSALRDAGLGADAWVLIHDAARPGLPLEALERLIDCCRRSSEVGGLLALPVADTVKQAHAGTASQALVQKSITRDRLWLAQTPQMFRADQLSVALQRAQSSAVDITDEASAMEHEGYTPILVPGSSRNFKVTWPEDFELMEKCL